MPMSLTGFYRGFDMIAERISEVAEEREFDIEPGGYVYVEALRADGLVDILRYSTGNVFNGAVDDVEPFEDFMI